jgi:hypothetical protein
VGTHLGNIRIILHAGQTMGLNVVKSGHKGAAPVFAPVVTACVVVGAVVELLRAEYDGLVSVSGPRRLD